jgi:hypothetical protein
LLPPVESSFPVTFYSSIVAEQGQPDKVRVSSFREAGCYPLSFLFQNDSPLHYYLIEQRLIIPIILHAPEKT